MPPANPDPDRTLARRSVFLIPAAVLMVTAAVYLSALAGGFVADDADQIVLAHARLAWHAIPLYFTRDVWDYLLAVPSNYYRPIFLLWLTIDYKLFGLEPVGWHAAALLLHLSATLIFFFLARRVTRDQPAAGIAALLFGVHPVHVEVVAWLSGVTDALLAVLGLGAMLCFMRAPEEPRTRWRWEAAALVLFSLALFSKETAVVLIALLGVIEWSRDRRSPPQSIGIRLAPYLGIVLVYFAARIHALGGVAPVGRAWTPAMIAYTLPGVFRFYLLQLTVPLDRYSFIHPLEAIRQFSFAQVAFPAVVVLAALGMLVWIARQGMPWAFSVALITLPLLPVLNLRAFAFDDIVHDRYLYLPSAGLCILLAMAMRRVTAIPGSPRGPALMACTLIVLAAGLSVVTVRTIGYWADDLTLYTRAVTVAPESTIAAEYLAGTLARQGRCDDALPLLKRALAVDMRNPDLYTKLAGCYENAGEWREAEDYLRQAVILFPTLAGSYAELTIVELHRNAVAEAEAHMRRAMELRVQGSALYAGYHMQMGQIFERKGDGAAALREYEAELGENPGSEKARDLLAALQQRMALPAAARADAPAVK